MSRQSRVTADVTLEAHNMLRDYCKKHERSKGFLLEKMIRKFCGDEYPVAITPTSKQPTIKRSKPKTYPSNLEDQFSMLWDTKGKKGSKKNAYAKFKALSENVTDEVCESFTQMLVDDILKRQHEIGVKDQHLITYLNKEEWDRD